MNTKCRTFSSNLTSAESRWNHDRDNTDKTPLCIHRAPLGTHERFIGFLIEHYAGNFPLWLAPEQVRVLPVTPDQIAYGEDLVKELRGQFVRASLEFSNDKLQGRILRAEEARVHTMLIVGAKEQTANAVAVRVHGQGNVIPPMNRGVWDREVLDCGGPPALRRFRGTPAR